MLCIHSCKLDAASSQTDAHHQHHNHNVVILLALFAHRMDALRHTILSNATPHMKMTYSLLLMKMLAIIIKSSVNLCLYFFSHDFFSFMLCVNYSNFNYPISIYMYVHRMFAFVRRVRCSI